MWVPHLKELWEAAAGKTLVYVDEPRNSARQNGMAAEKDGKILDICHEKCHGCALLPEERWKCSLHCDYYGSSNFDQANCSICLDFHGLNLYGFYNSDE